MYSKQIIALAFFVTVASATAVEKCKENEYFDTCASACEPICENPNPTVCTDNCVYGCACKKGFVRNHKGECVKLEDCPRKITFDVDFKTCGQNEVFKTCGTACEPECGKERPLICPAMCVEGCFCKDGYIKNAQGQCIPERECLVPESRLKCPPGTIQNFYGGCVQKQPRNQCGKNMEYKECGTVCEPKCGVKRPMICPAMCVSGCFCKEGYIFDKEGNCISERECEALERSGIVCGENEYFSECGTMCERECGKPQPLACPLACVKGCFCKPGFIRKGYACVPESFCTL